jgi:hypothetical protein
VIPQDYDMIHEQAARDPASKCSTPKAGVERRANRDDRAELQADSSSSQSCTENSQFLRSQQALEFK